MSFLFPDYSYEILEGRISIKKKKKNRNQILYESFCICTE